MPCRRVLPDGAESAGTALVLRLGALAVPPAVLLATRGLWVALRWLG